MTKAAFELQQNFMAIHMADSDRAERYVLFCRLGIEDNGDRVCDDSDRSFVSIHPSWHLNVHTLGKVSALLVFHNPVRLADQPAGEVC